MTYLSEDPTYLAGALLLLAGAFLVALNITQQGKYLVYAGVAFGLALSVVAIERLWITDNERIEQVVYDLRQAVQNSDSGGVLAHMAPSVQYLQGDTALSEEATRALFALTWVMRISSLFVSATYKPVPASNRGEGKLNFGFSSVGVSNRRRAPSGDGGCDAGHDLVAWFPRN